MEALTRWDILGCARGVAAFAVVLLAPGYCLAWVCDLLGFRSRPASERIAWGVALSFGLMAIVAVAVGKYGSLLAVCWIAGLCGIIFLGMVVGEFRKRPRGAGSNWGLVGVGIAAAWILFVVGESVDVGVGSRLYLSVTVFDHALRTAFVDSVMRTGVPPANPLFWAGHAAPMRYYYFWYVLAAVAARLGAVTARQAMIASVVWSGFGLAAVLSLYCRHFLGGDVSGGHIVRGVGRRWSRLGLALGLLAVTGLDILPAVVKAVFRMPADADMEWWSIDQVASWMDSILWVPHHVAGLVCCLFGFLLVWMSKGCRGTERKLCGLIAGVSFASAFGLSTWVAVAFAMVMLVWMGWALVWEPGSRVRVPVLLGAGLVAVLALLPYLAELHAAPSGSTASTLNGSNGAPSPVVDESIANPASHLLRFGVRHMIDPDALSTFPWFARAARSYPRLEYLVVGLGLLIPGYFVEFGFYGAVLFVALKAMRWPGLDESARTSLVVVVAGLVLSTFLRSTVIENNDFGFRSILVAQFFLLLLAVRWCEGVFARTSGSLRSVMYAMVWIGLAGTLYQAVGLRLYLPVEEMLGRPEFGGFAERAMALRRGFDEMGGRVPKDAVIQFNTAQPGDFFADAQVMQAGRQVASALPGCGTAFGGDRSACKGVEEGVARLFSPGLLPDGEDREPDEAISAAQARMVCGKLGVSYLVATRWDRVWSDPHNWVWNLPAVVNLADMRVLDCAAPTR